MNERDILSQRAFAVNKARKEGEAKGLAEGLAEGEVKGELKGKRETAKNMLREGLPIDMIGRITGLSAEQIQSL